METQEYLEVEMRNSDIVLSKASSPIVSGKDFLIWAFLKTIEMEVAIEEDDTCLAEVTGRYICMN